MAKKLQVYSGTAYLSLFSLDTGWIHFKHHVNIELSQLIAKHSYVTTSERTYVLKTLLKAKIYDTEKSVIEQLSNSFNMPMVAYILTDEVMFVIDSLYLSFELVREYPSISFINLKGASNRPELIKPRMNLLGTHGSFEQNDGTTGQGWVAGADTDTSIVTSPFGTGVAQEITVHSDPNSGINYTLRMPVRVWQKISVSGDVMLAGGSTDGQVHVALALMKEDNGWINQTSYGLILPLSAEKFNFTFTIRKNLDSGEGFPIEKVRLRFQKYSGYENRTFVIDNIQLELGHPSNYVEA